MTTKYHMIVTGQTLCGRKDPNYKGTTKEATCPGCVGIGRGIAADAVLRFKPEPVNPWFVPIPRPFTPRDLQGTALGPRMSREEYVANLEQRGILKKQ